MATNTDYFKISKSSIFNYQEMRPSQWGVVATLDYNYDGKEDFILHAIQYDSSSLADALPLVFMKGGGDGTFSQDFNALIGSPPNIFDARTAVGDFNRDGYIDIVLIDSGTSLGGNLTFKGGQTYFLAGQPTGQFKISPIPNTAWYAKNLSVIDINKDGFLDIYIESGGETGVPISAQLPPHFLINDGVGNFTPDISRIPLQVSAGNWINTISDFYNKQTPTSQSNRYIGESFGDFNNDGYLDIVFPSLDGSTTNPRAVDRVSKVLINNGFGNYLLSGQILLPEPSWNGGLLSGQSSTVGDINNDGYKDLIIGWTSLDYVGRYLQVLKNVEGKSFIDITDQVLGSQYLEKQVTDSFGQKNSNIRSGYPNLNLVDFNHDGFLDIFVQSTMPISPSNPIIYMNDGTGHFYPLSSKYLGLGNYFKNESGRAQFLIDANGDGVMDVGFADSNGSGINFSLFVNNIGPNMVHEYKLNGVLSDYTIMANKELGQLTISDSIQFRDGDRMFGNLQRLQFSDTNLALDIGPTQNAGSVYMLYKAAFNRPPDAGGMGYWLAQKDAGANIVTNIAQGFVNAPEFIAKYGTNPTNASYVDKLYLNVLGRPGEAGGVAYWNAELDAGKRSKAEVLVQFATLPEGASLVANLIANGIAYQEWLG